MLGLPWDTRMDSINLHLRVNLSVKRHCAWDGDELTVDTVHLLDTAVLTRRIMLSQVYSIYDPLGLLSPLTICYKLLLQWLVMLNQPWDEPIEGELLDQARTVLRELVLAQDIEFPRCVLPNDREDWMLLGYWDGGKPASSCCLYVRTKLDSPGMKSNCGMFSR